MQPTDPHPPSYASVAREQRYVRISAILWFAFWLALSAAVIQVGLWGLFRFFAARTRSEQPAVAPNVAASLKRTPSEPRLEPLPLAPRRELRAAEDARLSSYGWVDRSGGVARIPIDRAMQIIVERGVPGGKPFPSAAPPAQAGAAAGTSPGAPGR
jgi:hypothetical protein